MVSVFYFTPLPGFFSPFPHGTCSLSVIRKYLALRDGPRGFRQNFSCFVVLRIHFRDCMISHTRLSRFTAILSRIFCYQVILQLRIECPTTPVLRLVWALTVSLATTKVIDFSFFSSCYLDVSVHRVVLYITMCSLCDTNVLLLVSSLIRISPDQSLLTAPRSIS